MDDVNACVLLSFADKQHAFVALGRGLVLRGKVVLPVSGLKRYDIDARRCRRTARTSFTNRALIDATITVEETPTPN